MSMSGPISLLFDDGKSLILNFELEIIGEVSNVTELYNHIFKLNSIYYIFYDPNFPPHNKDGRIFNINKGYFITEQLDINIQNATEEYTGYILDTNKTVYKYKYDYENNNFTKEIIYKGNIKNISGNWLGLYLII